MWRVGSSFVGPLRPDFMEVTMSSPDLYGPFWVVTTLVFVTAGEMAGGCCHVGLGGGGGPVVEGPVVERSMNYVALGLVCVFMLSVHVGCCNTLCN